MRVTGPDVVAAWGGFNSLLLAIHLGYGGGTASPIPFAIYGSSVGLVELVALTAFWVHRTRSAKARLSPAPARSHAALMVAVAAAFVGAGLIYRPWMMLPAIYPLLVLGKEAVSALAPHHEPEPLPSGEPSSDTEPHELTRNVAVTAAAVAAVVTVARSARRRLRPSREPDS